MWVTLHWKFEGAQYGRKPIQADMTEFRRPKAEVAQTVCQVRPRNDLRDEKDDIDAGDEKFYDWHEVQYRISSLPGVALGKSIRDELLTLDVGNELQYRLQSSSPPPRDASSPGFIGEYSVRLS